MNSDTHARMCIFALCAPASHIGLKTGLQSRCHNMLAVSLLSSTTCLHACTDLMCPYAYTQAYQANAKHVIHSSLYLFSS